MVIATFTYGAFQFRSSKIHFLMPEKLSTLKSMGEATRTQHKFLIMIHSYHLDIDLITFTFSTAFKKKIFICYFVTGQN